MVSLKVLSNQVWIKYQYVFVSFILLILICAFLANKKQRRNCQYETLYKWGKRRYISSKNVIKLRFQGYCFKSDTIFEWIDTWNYAYIIHVPLNGYRFMKKNFSRKFNESNEVGFGRVQRQDRKKENIWCSSHSVNHSQLCTRDIQIGKINTFIKTCF